MLKRDYFIKALKSNAIKKKHWVFSAFSVVKNETKTPATYPYQIKRDDEGVVSFYNPETTQWEAIPDAEKDQPVFGFLESFMLPGGILDNLPEKTETNYGNALVNELVLCIPFKDKIPYQNGYFDISAIEDIISRDLISDPEPDEDTDFYAPNGKIYVRQKALHSEHIQAMVAYNPISVTSVTPKSLLKHPGAQALKEELMEKYKDQLTDPAIVARIGDALEALDREWLKDDPSMNFYIKGKYFTTVRKKLHYFFGGESPFEDGSTVTMLPKSLDEGIDVSKFPVYINSMREGSYNRGRQTELGGAATKGVYRAMSTVSVGDDDCGVLLGVTRFLAKAQRSDWIGCTIVENNENVLLSEENIDKYLDKEVILRSPYYCKTKDLKVCKTCIGHGNAEIEYGLPAATAGITSTCMSIFLASFHGKALKTAKWDPKLAIR